MAVAPFGRRAGSKSKYTSENAVSDTEAWRGWWNAGPPAPGKPWTTKDGKVVPLPEMTDTHLANAIAFLERREAEGGEREWLALAWRHALLAELERRTILNADAPREGLPALPAGEEESARKALPPVEPPELE